MAALISVAKMNGSPLPSVGILKSQNRLIQDLHMNIRSKINQGLIAPDLRLPEYQKPCFRGDGTFYAAHLDPPSLYDRGLIKKKRYPDFSMEFETEGKDAAALLKENEVIEKKLRSKCQPFLQGRLPNIIAEKHTYHTKITNQNKDDSAIASVAWNEHEKQDLYTEKFVEKSFKDTSTLPSFLDKCVSEEKMNLEYNGTSKEEYKRRAKTFWNAGEVLASGSKEKPLDDKNNGKMSQNSQTNNDKMTQNSQKNKDSSNESQKFQESTLENVAGAEFASDVTGDNKKTVRMESEFKVKDDENAEGSEKKNGQGRSTKGQGLSSDSSYEKEEENEEKKDKLSKAVEMAEMEMIVELAAETAVSGPKEAWEMAEADATVLSQTSRKPKEALLDEITKGAEKVSKKALEEMADSTIGDDDASDENTTSKSLLGLESVSEVGLAIESVIRRGKEQGHSVQEMTKRIMEEIREKIRQAVEMGMHGREVAESIIHEALVRGEGTGKAIGEVVEEIEKKLSQAVEMGKHGTQVISDVVYDSMVKAEERAKFVAHTVEEVEKDLEHFAVQLDAASKQGVHVEADRGEMETKEKEKSKYGAAHANSEWKNVSDKEDYDTEDEFVAGWERSLLGEEWEDHEKADEDVGI